MRKINFLTVIMAVLLLVASAGARAEDKKAKEYIPKFEQGRKLTAGDIKFLNSISNGKADSKTATIGKSQFKAGQTINASEADAINNAKAEFKKSHKLAKATDAKPIDKTRGNENCYWYLYCDGYGNCYYIWYCD